MFWDLSMDHRQGEGREHEMMIPIVTRQLGQLQWRENELDYYESSEYGKKQNGTAADA